MKYDCPARLTLLGLAVLCLTSCFEDPTSKFKEQLEWQKKKDILEKEIIEMSKKDAGAPLPENWRDQLIQIKEERMAIDSQIVEKEHTIKALAEDLEKNNLRLEEFRTAHSIN